MTVLGYAKIMQLLTGTNEYEFENYMVRISKHGLSKLRIEVLKELAKQERETIGTILKELKENTTGGTFKSIK